MKSDRRINDELLLKYLLQEADEQEALRIDTWLQDSAENQKHFDEMKLIWEKSLQLVEGSEDLESIAWRKIEDRLNFNAPEQEVLNPKEEVQKIKYFHIKRQLLIAASILLVCNLGWFTFNYFKTPEIVSINAKDQIIAQILPDGSNVTLNKNTLISYPDRFNGATRPIKLKGEAFFHVAPDKSKPFIISVNEVTVKVVGTSFNVKSRNNKTVIVVETGIVQVIKAKNKVELRPGESVTIDQHNGKLQKEKGGNTLYNYYYSHELNCKSTPLPELVAVLNEKFKTEIIIGSPALTHMQITANFTNYSLEEILSVISMTFKVKVEHKNQQILLK